MRAGRTLTRRRNGNNGGVQWLSFSDLMSSLLLIFILIMFYIMYQYFDMYEINMAEIARQQFDLDAANASLDEERAKLSEAETQMVAQQIRLNAAEKNLTDAQSILAAQQDELAKAQSLVEEKEQEIAAQQEKLDALSIQLDDQQSRLDAQQQVLEDQQQVLEDQQRQIEQLVGVRPRIIASLRDALQAHGITAQVDPNTGSIALESNMLFEYNSYDLSPEGQAFIDRFLPVYLDVLFSDEYRPYVAEIIIEGHTDSTGTYIKNLELSQQRALAVASYVLGDGYTGISSARKAQLRVVATANGRSFSDPVLDANGNEDMDASRRVVFKFRLTDEQMIHQMQSILEANDAGGAK